MEYTSKYDSPTYDIFHNCFLYHIYLDLFPTTNTWALLAISYSQPTNVHYEDLEGQIYVMDEE